MASAFQVIVQPTQEPIGLSEAKLHLRVDYDEEDMLIARQIVSARQQAEAIMHRALATQTIRCIETIARPVGGVLSGAIDRGPNWYEYQEQLGANPFGAAMFYFDLSMPPCQSVTSVQTKVTVWDPWQDFTGPTYLDNVPEPARLYFQVPVTANQWKFEYVAGYDGVTFMLPNDIRQALLDTVAFYFDHREGDTLPPGIVNRFLAHRLDWI